MILKRFDFGEFLDELENAGLVSPDYSTVGFAGGETALLPDSCINAAKTKGYRIGALTNAVKFDDRLIDGKCSIGPVSIDAGTKETYHRVKGMDAFDEVWKNIRKYRDSGLSFTAKYIFLAENCNETDISGFISKVADAGIPSVHISANWDEPCPFSDEQLELIINMIVTLEKYSVLVYIDPRFETRYSSEVFARIKGRYHHMRSE